MPDARRTHALRTPAPRRARRWLLWLLALLILLQGVAVGVLTATGPAHVHRDPGDLLVLNDVRRWTPGPALEDASAFAFLGHTHEHMQGHTHGHATPQRHYHAHADRSVVVVGDDGALKILDADEGPGAGASLALAFALIPATLVWRAPKPAGTRAWRALWTPQTGFTSRLDRPPKRA